MDGASTSEKVIFHKRSSEYTSFALNFIFFLDHNYHTFRHPFLPTSVRFNYQPSTLSDHTRLQGSDHHWVHNMSPSTSTSQHDQRAHASPSYKSRSTAPSTASPTRKPRHSPDPLHNRKNSAGQSSSVFGSRIEKKRTSHKKRATGSTVRTTASTASAVLTRVVIKNRLGARNEILCSPSDTIGAFKKVAAVHLGTRPEAMLLKRQGERRSETS